jgi:hypothetical protein
LSIGLDVWRIRWRNQVTTAVTGAADLHTTCGALLKPSPCWPRFRPTPGLAWTTLVSTCWWTGRCLATHPRRQIKRCARWLRPSSA